MSEKISDEELLAELKRIRDLLNRAPRQKEVQEHSKFSVNAYKRAFGGINNALKKIGEIPTMEFGQTKEKALSELKRIYKELGRIPTTDEFSTLSTMSYVTFRKLVENKSWHTVLKEIGISDDELINLRKHNVSNEELKNEIVRLKEIYGRYPTYNEMSTCGIFSPDLYSTRFGSWSKSFIELGFADYVSQSVYKNQIHSQGKDGIMYRSYFESSFGNLLFELKEMNKIKNYIYEKKVCENKTWTCDFVIETNDGEEIWIELDGMMGNRKNPYDENNEKIAYYIKNNLSYQIITYDQSIKDELVKLIKEI